MYATKTVWRVEGKVAKMARPDRGFVVTIDADDLVLVEGLGVLVTHLDINPRIAVQRRKNNVVWNMGLAKFLMGSTGKESVRHRDGDPFNNTRSNLYVHPTNGSIRAPRTIEDGVVFAPSKHGVIMYDEADDLMLSGYSLSITKVRQANKEYLNARAYPYGSANGMALSRLLMNPPTRACSRPHKPRHP